MISPIATSAVVLALCATMTFAAPPVEQNTADTQQVIAEERLSVIVQAVQKVSPSVASVVVSGIQRVPIFNDPFYRDFFGLGPATTRRFTVQSGSAVMISSAGEFLTNQHVVGGADTIRLLLPNGESRLAEVIGTSPELDVALLKCNPEGMEPAQLGAAKNLLVGEWLVAVGYPVGGRRGLTEESRVRPTVTVGVVSALERSFVPSTRQQTRSSLFYPDMIQTDAAINPGNSGGPLANASGEVVGINTFILSDTGGSQGLGFAIPIERALKAADEIRTYGRVRRVNFSGLQFYRSISDEKAASIGLEEGQGLMVADPGIADEAGLRRDDVIIDVDRKPVRNFDDAQLALVPRFVGDQVTLGVWRNEIRIELQLVLTEAQDQ
ncbi:MAG: trypsin-like peptidase domain-containing protein [Acidobacteriota bacterium]|nr:trypsin-like peptidase domain-containing protein [Acidobacteriota bacterium]